MAVLTNKQPQQQTALSKEASATIGWRWLILLLIVAAVTWVRWHFLEIPLERDEGEYAYSGQLMLQGVPPYKLAYNLKMPGTYAIYAIILAIFGQTVSGIHLGLLVLNVATILLMFLLGRRFFGNSGGLITAGTYAMLSCSFQLNGLAAHANHFVIFFTAAGMVALFAAQEKAATWKFLGSGILFGLGFLMKQHAIVFIAFANFALFYRANEIRSRSSKPSLWQQFMLLNTGVAIPFVITCVLLAITGVFQKFWFWTFQYGGQYVSFMTLNVGMLVFRETFSGLLNFTWPLFVFAAAGLVLLLKWPATRRDGVWFGIFLLASVCGVSIGFFFRPNYYILLIPAISLLAGATIACVRNLAADRPMLRYFTGLAFIGALGYTLLLHLPWFSLPPDKLSVLSYGENPFVKAPKIANYIREHSKPDDRVAIIGSEPEIYFLSQRRSATGYIYTYPLMEPQPFALQMQREMIREIETAQPRFMVMVSFDASWLQHGDSDRFIFDWSGEYFNKFYTPVAVLDFVTMDDVKESWGEAAGKNPPQASNYLVLFERK